MDVTYSQLPPDLRMSNKKEKILCWSTRGKVIVIENNDEVRKLIREGRIWRKISKEEAKSGMKAGSYNPIYDKGEENCFKHSKINPTIAQTTGALVGDKLGVIEI